jgi:hypothetical protein
MAPRKRHIEPAAESKDHGNKFCGLRADASPTDSDQGHWLEYQRRAEQRDKLVKRRAPLYFAFIHKADGMPLERRMLFRLSEIADLHATVPPALSPDPVRRAEILVALRLAIQRGEFVDASGRSRIRNLHPSPLSELRFDPHSARDSERFPELASHLWVNHRDIVAWFDRRNLKLPAALQRDVPPAPWWAPNSAGDDLSMVRKRIRAHSVVLGKPHKRKRKRRTGFGYAIADAPLLDRMEDLVESGTATSVYSAALMVAGDAKGANTLHESKARRLERRYRARKRMRKSPG